MEIKICGLTRPQEAQYLNENHADYAGFVLFCEKSKRNLSLEQAKEIMAQLDPRIKKVAVTVSPTVEQTERIEQTGFDLLQVHGELSEEVLRTVKLPVWYACNLKEESSLTQLRERVAGLPGELAAKITGIVVDGAGAGSGKTFDWSLGRRMLGAGNGIFRPGTVTSPDELGIGDRSVETGTVNRSAESGTVNSPVEPGHVTFILAGGLNPENVEEAVRLFSPDIVDVSSGVEGQAGKDEELIRSFVERARRQARMVKSADRTVIEGKEEEQRSRRQGW